MACFTGSVKKIPQHFTTISFIIALQLNISSRSQHAKHGLRLLPLDFNHITMLLALGIKMHIALRKRHNNSIFPEGIIN